MLPSPATRRCAAVLTALTCLFLTGGCGADDADGSGSPSGCTEDPASTREVTETGQDLCLGTQARIATVTELGRGSVGFTVTEVGLADPEVLPTAFEAIEASGFDPDDYQVVEARITAELLDEDPAGAISGSDNLQGNGGEIGQLFGSLWSVEYDDDELEAARGPGSLPGCEQPVFEADAEPGATVEGCAWFLTKGSGEPVAVTYENLLGQRALEEDVEDDPTYGTLTWVAAD